MLYDRLEIINGKGSFSKPQNRGDLLSSDEEEPTTQQFALHSAGTKNQERERKKKKETRADAVFQAV